MPSTGYEAIRGKKKVPTRTTIPPCGYVILITIPIKQSTQVQMAIEVIVKTITNGKSHSFRIGGATNAISKGVPYEKVKEMGRWQSDAAKRYIRIPSINVAALV